MSAMRKARSWTLAGALLAVVVLAVAACGGSSSKGAAPAPCARHGSAVAIRCASASVSASPSASSSIPPSGIPPFKHVVLVIFENRAFSQVMGTSSASYFNQLAKGGANFTNSHAITHPSQPNYLALYSGSTHGLSNDSCPHTFTTANLGGDLIAAGKTFTGYAESLPASGPKTCTSGNYARKHIPWVNFTSVPASATKSFTSFPQTASANFAALPSFSWVTPNLCNDMHNCSVSVGNTWLSGHMSAYANWAKANDSLLIVTFDENDGSAGNQIPTIFYGDHVKPGNYTGSISHYNVLRTIEDEFGLPHDGAAATATPITNVWNYGGS
jgi:phospholipase C